MLDAHVGLPVDSPPGMVGHLWLLPSLDPGAPLLTLDADPTRPSGDSLHVP